MRLKRLAAPKWWPIERKTKKFVKVIIWVHETSTKYFVYKLHSTRI